GGLGGERGGTRAEPGLRGTTGGNRRSNGQGRRRAGSRPGRLESCRGTRGARTPAKVGGGRSLGRRTPRRRSVRRRISRAAARRKGPGAMKVGRVVVGALGALAA